MRDDEVPGPATHAFGVLSRWDAGQTCRGRPSVGCELSKRRP